MSKRIRSFSADPEVDGILDDLAWGRRSKFINHAIRQYAEVKPPPEPEPDPPEAPNALGPPENGESQTSTKPSENSEDSTSSPDSSKEAEETSSETDSTTTSGLTGFLQLRRPTNGG